MTKNHQLNENKVHVHLVAHVKKSVTHPCPIFSILVYFLLGSPTLTIVLNRSKISSSLIFFLRPLSLGVLGSPPPVPPPGPTLALLRFLSRVPLVVRGGGDVGTDTIASSSIGFVYCDNKTEHN